ncbi:unnamed protein product [Ilex paraguariensis]|uniref:CRAL-TRIO domain-containing protein n=1 Tax=Ilex paraguariensis TaxID=185542 RepID=A0ABC8SHX5_9AQUA
MGVVSEEAINQFQALMDIVEEPLNRTFKNVHQEHPREALVRFLKAREGNVAKAHKMLVDCLKWRVQNEIDDILAPYIYGRISTFTMLQLSLSLYKLDTTIVATGKKPIVPADLYRAIRDSQLIGLPEYSKEGLPVFAIGVGLSTFDKASLHYYVQSHIQINEYRDRVVLPAATKKYGKLISKCVKVLDMTGLKLSALGYIKLLSIISTIDDLNYPEKTLTYYIVNAPYVFSACWKVVKPLLQERTRLKVQVLPGCGQDELLKIMDYSSLPHFCRKEGSGSSRHSGNSSYNCFSLDHPFHQQLYSYIKQQALIREPVAPIKQGSVHVDLPEAGVEGTEFAKILESKIQTFGNQDGLAEALDNLKSDNDRT